MPHVRSPSRGELRARSPRASDRSARPSRPRGSCSSVRGSSECMFDDHRTNACYLAEQCSKIVELADLLPSLTAALAWGAMFPIAASAIKHVDPFHLTAIRYGIAALVFLGCSWRSRAAARCAPTAARSSCSCSARSASPASTCSPTSASSTRRPQDAALIVATAAAADRARALADARARRRRATTLARDGRRAARRRARDHPAATRALVHGDGRAGELLVLARRASAGSPTRSAPAASPSSRRCATRR